MVKLMIFQHWFWWWLGTDKVIIWINDGKFTDAYMSHSASMSQLQIFIRASEVIQKEMGKINQ